MKKILIIIGLYIAAVFGVFVAVSFGWGHVPALLPGAASSYKFFRALYIYLDVFSPIIISGFIVGCSVEWKANPSASLMKFSSAMVTRFRNVILIALGIIFILVMNREVFMPSINRRQTAAERAPSSLERNLNLSKIYLLEDRPDLALQYAYLAQQIAPKDKEVIATFKKAKDATDVAHDKEIYLSGKTVVTAPKKIETPVQDADSGFTVLELLNKSRAEAEKKNWVNAHYWATLAVKACSGTDTNRENAISAANYAWNKLSEPVEFDNEEEKNLYMKKKEGYTALNNGDNLKAYYIFNSLESENEVPDSDPDVKRYLSVAREKVLTQYFFIDETSEMKRMNNNQNIHFSLTKNDGTVEVVYIKGLMDVAQDGGYVRYAEGFNLASFDADGRFQYSMSVPFAKIIGVSTSDFNDDSLYAMGIDRKWESVPLIMMVSVDRQTEGVISAPVYSYDVSDIPSYILSEHKLNVVKDYEAATVSEVDSSSEFMNERNPNIMVLPMRFDDIDILNQASSNPSEMDIVSVSRFIEKADCYGYSSQVYRQSFVYRVTYPLYMLILIIFAASSAWNYRLAYEKELFHFNWILVLPFLNLMLSVICEMLMYIANLLDYALVGMFGSMAMLIAIFIYLILLVIFSIHFLSRTSR